MSSDKKPKRRRIGGTTAMDILCDRAQKRGYDIIDFLYDLTAVPGLAEAMIDAAIAMRRSKAAVPSAGAEPDGNSTAPETGRSRRYGPPLSRHDFGGNNCGY